MKTFQDVNISWMPLSGNKIQVGSCVERDMSQTYIEDKMVEISSNMFASFYSLRTVKQHLEVKHSENVFDLCYQV